MAQMRLHWDVVGGVLHMSIDIFEDSVKTQAAAREYVAAVLTHPLIDEPTEALAERLNAEVLAKQLGLTS